MNKIALKLKCDYEGIKQKMDGRIDEEGEDGKIQIYKLGMRFLKGLE